jgi:hypothetical protein
MNNEKFLKYQEYISNNKINNIIDISNISKFTGLTVNEVLDIIKNYNFYYEHSMKINKMLDEVENYNKHCYNCDKVTELINTGKVNLCKDCLSLLK